MKIMELIRKLLGVHEMYGDLDCEIPGGCVDPYSDEYIPERIQELHVYSPGGVVYLESQTRVEVD